MNQSEALSLSLLNSSVKKATTEKVIQAQALIDDLLPEDESLFVSGSYVLQEVDITSVGCPVRSNANEVQRLLAQAGDDKTPIVIDKNPKRLGRTRSGYIPKRIVIYGAAQFEATVLSGRSRILAWVGKGVKSRITGLPTLRHGVNKDNRVGTPLFNNEHQSTAGTLAAAMEIEACTMMKGATCPKCGYKIPDKDMKDMEGGGPGSGCNPATGKCGRKKGMGHGPNVKKVMKEQGPSARPMHTVAQGFGYKSSDKETWGHETPGTVSYTHKEGHSLDIRKNGWTHVHSAPHFVQSGRSSKSLMKHLSNVHHIK